MRVLAGFLTVALATLMVPAHSAGGGGQGDRVAGVHRIDGADRFAVSAAISAATFSKNVPVVYIASGEGFADALPASATAGAQHGPVLLVTRTAIPGVIETELRRLQPRRIVIAGGTAVIDPAVESRLRTFAPIVERAAGSDRFEGSVRVSESFRRGGVGTPNQSVYVASGLDFPDALAAAPLAAWVDAPVLLTRPDEVPDAVVAEIRRLRPERVFVLGGDSVVSDGIVRQLDDEVLTMRMGGRDRYETARAVSDNYRGEGYTVYIASGESFPDALSGGAAAAQDGSPLLIVQKDSIPAVIASELRRMEPKEIVVLGGTVAVSPAVEAELASYIKP